jgi:hypothetical protein
MDIALFSINCENTNAQYPMATKFILKEDVDQLVSEVIFSHKKKNNWLDYQEQKFRHLVILQLTQVSGNVTESTGRRSTM